MYRLNAKIRLTMLCLSGLYSRWVPLSDTYYAWAACAVCSLNSQISPASTAHRFHLADQLSLLSWVLRCVLLWETFLKVFGSVESDVRSENSTTTCCVAYANDFRTFDCHTTKLKIANRPVEEAKKMKCYKRLIHKQFVQVSGLFCPHFSELFAETFQAPF